MEGTGDEVLLPGFRFHPTDEELVEFYLKRKAEQKPLAIELIRQLDIYKYDPWDLPNLAPSTGDKEWYFYCPRGRKYRNSARPNRVTVTGFWKATGTDRPIYSAEGTKCIGLKKSLVFYRGRAARGTKTEWMMHEFRLPSLNNSPKMPTALDHIHPNEAWAICRIFKKSSSMAQRALINQYNIVPPMPENKKHDIFSSNSNAYSLLDFSSYKPITYMSPPPIPISEIPAGFMFSPDQCSADATAMPHLNLGKASSVISLDSGEQQVVDKESEDQATFYMTNDQSRNSEFPIDFPWDCLPL